jgi:hypothetical protein
VLGQECRDVLGDIDELVTRCRTEEARTYVAEAVACYKAGAYRSCIVATWIAVVYDLIAKVRELASAGDAEAQRLIGEIDRLHPKVAARDVAAIKKILEIEHGILDTVSDKFAFFDAHESIELSRLRNDRQRCAHPTYQGTERPYAPTAELARAHLVHAVQYVLALPPVQGKAATTAILAQVTSAYFPLELEPAKARLKAAGLDRPKDSLVRNVFDQLVLGFFEGERDTAALKSQRRTLAAIKAVHHMYPATAEARLRHHLNRLGGRLEDRDQRLFFPFIRRIPASWDVLEQDHRDRLAQIIQLCDDATAATLLRFALAIPGLKKSAKKRLDTLPSAELSDVLQLSKHQAAIERAVDLYCESSSYDQANTRYAQVIEPILDYLTRDQIERILVAADEEGADLNGAYSLSEFARYIYEQKKIPQERVLKLLRDHHMANIAERLARTEESDEEREEGDDE